MADMLFDIRTVIRNIGELRKYLIVTMLLMCLLATLSGCSQRRPQTAATLAIERTDIEHASALLDDADGDSRKLVRARIILDGVLKKNPEARDAYYQYARYHIVSDARNTDQYGAGHLSRADVALSRALKIDPDFSEAYVLRGYLYTLMSRIDEAKQALRTAEHMGSKSAWLDMHWGSLYLAEDNIPMAAQRCQKVIDNPTAPDRAKLSAYGCLIAYHTHAGRLKEADSLYRKQIGLIAGDSAVHAEYADFLLCSTDDYVSAIKQAEVSLSIKRNRVARAVLAASLYRQWAAKMQAAHTDPEKNADAQRSWIRAEEVSEQDPTDLLIQQCRDGRALFQTLMVLRDHQHAHVYSGDELVARTEYTGSDGAAGVYEIEVMEMSHETTGILLKSKPIGENQHIVVIRVGQQYISAFENTYGDMQHIALKRKRIQVVGRAVHEIISHGSRREMVEKTRSKIELDVTNPAQIMII